MIRILAVLLLGCGGDDGTAASVVGEPCTDAAACGEDFTCEDVGGSSLCTAHCSEDADCGAGGRCVDVGTEGDPSRTCLKSCDGDPESCPEGTTCVVWAAGPAAACR